MSFFGTFLGVAFSTAATLIPAVSETRSGKTDVNAHSFSFAMPNGETLELSSFAGRPVLVVNTATECGFSDQLAGLQNLHERYTDRGLVVLGVPSNDFGGQEPRADGEIAQFCKSEYGAKFLLTSKTSVKGEMAHPFYKWASDVLGKKARPFWNFHKYLIAPDGSIAAFYATPVKPTSSRITRAIERELANRQESLSAAE